MTDPEKISTLAFSAQVVLVLVALLLGVSVLVYGATVAAERLGRWAAGF